MRTIRSFLRPLCVGLMLLPTALNADTAGIVQKQTMLKGLLVIELGNGEMAGTASQMNATAITTGDSRSETSVHFNQEVGDSMEKGLKEVVKHLRVKHGDKWAFGHEIEIAFKDKYMSKDGASASTACALMLDAMITGRKLDKNFAVTGDMNADGSVLAVGGVPAKLRGAIKKKSQVVAVPLENRLSLLDSVISDGIGTMARINVFTIKNLDEAIALSGEERSEQITESIKEFELVQRAVRKDTAYLRNAKVQEKLKNILKLTPNHLSARILLLKGTNRLPKQLTLEGSIITIDRSSSAVMDAIRKDGKMELGGLTRDQLAGALNEIRDKRKVVDKRVVPYADSLEDLGRLIREFQAKPPNAYPMFKKKYDEIQSAALKVDGVRDKIVTESAEELLD